MCVCVYVRVCVKMKRLNYTKSRRAHQILKNDTDSKKQKFGSDRSGHVDMLIVQKKIIFYEKVEQTLQYKEMKK